MEKAPDPDVVLVKWYPCGMSLANSNGPQWIRAQHAETKKRWEGIAPIRVFLRRLFGLGATEQARDSETIPPIDFPTA